MKMDYINSALKEAQRASEQLQKSIMADRRHIEAMNLERQKVNAGNESARQLKQQTLQQVDMIKATFQMVEKQQDANELQETSNKLLKEQLVFLQKQNQDQAKELKRSHLFQWVSWIVTTLIAISAIIVQTVKL